MDDLGQLIFVVLFILFGLISSSKKKASTKPRARGATPPSGAIPNRVPEQGVSTLDNDSQVPAEIPGHAEEVDRPRRVLAEELLVFLQGEAEPMGEPVVVPLEVDDEAESVETLVPAGPENHKQYREKSVDVAPEHRPYALTETPAPRPYAVTDTDADRPYSVEEANSSQPYAIHDRSKRKRQLTRSELRHAFVMKEVLGPPKALE